MSVPIIEQCKVALQALNDWAVTYGADMSDTEEVQKAKARMLEHGTLWYIANAQHQLNRAISALSEADQRVKDARRKALEEAAAYHDDLAAQHAASSKEERHHVARDQHAAFCAQHQRHSAAIRALQSEER